MSAPGRHNWSTVSNIGEYATVLAVLGLGVALRLFWVLRLPVEPQSDFLVFESMARSMARGSWDASSYGWTYQGPGYPLTLVPAALISDDQLAMLLTNVLFQTLTCACVWLLARRVLDRIAATAALVFVALLPGIWLYTAVVAAENLGILLLSVIGLLLTVPRTRASMLALGMATGALAVTRPGFLLFVPLLLGVVVVGLVRYRQAILSSWLIAGAFLTLAPIVLLNLANDGEALPAAASSWQIWLVNNEHATGGWFPAAEMADYPFQGLDESTSRVAQRKLGLQFVIANPFASISNSLDRYQDQWREDTLGLVWTLDAAPAEWQERIPLRDELPALSNGMYFAVLLLGVFGALRYGKPRHVGFAVVLPLVYGIALCFLAEANRRYHLMLLPTLCVIASGAFFRLPVFRISPAGIVAGARQHARTAYQSYRRGDDASTLRALTLTLLIGFTIWWLWIARRLSIGSPATWLAVWRWPDANAGGWLTLVVLVVLIVVRLLGSGIDGFARATMAIHRHPVVSLVAALGLSGALVGTSAWLVSQAEQGIAEIAAVQPEGWNRYFITGDGVQNHLGVVLSQADVAPSLRQVSYPDGAFLNFPQSPRPRETVGLERTVIGLSPGHSYTFYLQVFDPGADGDPSEELVVKLDEQIVWQRLPGTTAAASWTYVVLPWLATSEALVIRVERTAGQDPLKAESVIPVVRTLHVYPLY